MVIALNFSQRYYHFVALQGSRSVLRKEFFEKWKIREIKKERIDKDCKLFHYSMSSKLPFYRGAVNNESGSGFKPNNNDLLVVEYSKLNIVLIGFPFRRMAIELINSLVSSYGVLSRSRFIKVDMFPLLEESHKHTDMLFEGNQYWLVGVFIDVFGSSYLSTVKLAGNKPLDSEIYKEYFKDKLLNDKTNHILNRSILKSKVDIGSEGDQQLIISTLHIDRFGNYKLFLQDGAKNLKSLHIMFYFLNHLNCLKATSNKPSDHIENDEI